MKPVSKVRSRRPESAQTPKDGADARPRLRGLEGATLDCDVLVIGGGAAGVAAATAAGRAGARVVLLERYGFLGGLATAGAVGAVCGLYLRDSASSKPALVGSGFLPEFAERLARASGAAPVRLDHGLWVLPYRPWAFAQVADTVVSEIRSVTLVLHATVAEVVTEGGRIRQVRALVWNDLRTVRPQCVVDGSGEATAAALAGGAVEDGRADQSPALTFGMENADPGLARGGWLAVLRDLRRAVDEGQLPAGCDQLSLVPGAGGDGRVVFKLSLAVERRPPTRRASRDPSQGAGPEAGAPSSRELAQPAWNQHTTWERDGRAKVDAIQRFLLGNVASFRGARFAGAAVQIGVRTGRRVRGLATLRDEDVLGCRKCAEGIARGCWPMEQWHERPQPVVTFFAERDFYEIPLGCLRPAGLTSVFAAGRCLSATPGALASARDIGKSLATGWAAGSAAASEAEGKPLAEAIDRIRRQMTE